MLFKHNYASYNYILKVAPPVFIETMIYYTYLMIYTKHNKLGNYY